MNRKDFKNKSEMQIFLSYFKPHRKLFFLDMACALGIAMIDLAFPFISRWCMYKLLPDNAWRTFWTVMAIVFCAYILRSVFTYIITYWGHTFGVRVETDFRHDLFQHIQELRELIERRLAHKRANLRHARVIGTVVGAAVFHLQIGRVHVHGTKLVHNERLAILSDARRVVENGALVFQINHRREHDEHDKHERKRNKAKHDIEHALKEVLIHPQPRIRHTLRRSRR